MLSEEIFEQVLKGNKEELKNIIKAYEGLISAEQKHPFDYSNVHIENFIKHYEIIITDRIEVLIDAVVELRAVNFARVLSTYIASRHANNRVGALSEKLESVIDLGEINKLANAEESKVSDEVISTQIKILLGDLDDSLVGLGSTLKDFGGPLRISAELNLNKIIEEGYIELLVSEAIAYSSITNSTALISEIEKIIAGHPNVEPNQKKACLLRLTTTPIKTSGNNSIGTK